MSFFIDTASPLTRVFLTVLITVLGFGMFALDSRGDQGQPEKGQKMFQTKGCVACHSIGKGKIVGPDLLGVTKIRDKKWLKEWIKSPDTMVMTDPEAKKLLQEYMTPMPNLGLSDQEIDVLIEFFEYNDSHR